MTLIFGLANNFYKRIKNSSDFVPMDIGASSDRRIQVVE